MQKRIHVVICLLATLGAAETRAQNLEMVSPPASSVSGPSRGLSMAQVERRFGEPVNFTHHIERPFQPFAFASSRIMPATAQQQHIGLLKFACRHRRTK